MIEYADMTLGRLESLYEGKVNLYVGVAEWSDKLYDALLEKLSVEQAMADDLVDIMFEIKRRKK